MIPWKRWVVRAASSVGTLVALPVLIAAALVARPRTVRRQRSGEKPRVVLGPVPMINSKHIAKALRAHGYNARTVVDDVYAIHTAADFDERLWDRYPRGRRISEAAARLLFLVIGPYLTLARLFFRFDVFHFYFNGGFLYRTPLRFWEVDLLHLAGKKVVFMPYGGDVAVPSEMRSLAWRQGLMTHYPESGRHEQEVKRRIQRFSEQADFVVACLVHFETLPRWDMLTTLYYPIDTDEWRPDGRYADADGISAPVTVVHAPNHRALKGTDYLIDACRQLQEEGLRVELRLLERVPNAEVKRAMLEADIVADQFILGFAMTALEGMSLGKPVLSNLSEPGYYETFREATGLSACAIVDSSPLNLKDNLKRLVLDPELRGRIGEASRRYVEQYHSYESVGRMWDSVYDQIWYQTAHAPVAWDPLRDEGANLIP